VRFPRIWRPVPKNQVLSDLLFLDPQFLVRQFGFLDGVERAGWLAGDAETKGLRRNPEGLRTGLTALGVSTDIGRDEIGRDATPFPRAGSRQIFSPGATPP